LLELIYVPSANALILPGGHNHRHVSLLATDQHRLSLRGIQKGGKSLFGLGSGYGSHIIYIRQNRQNVQYGCFLRPESPVHYLPYRGITQPIQSVCRIAASTVFPLHEP
jgi:hypothetical protein